MLRSFGGAREGGWVAWHNGCWQVEIFDNRLCPLVPGSATLIREVVDAGFWKRKEMGLHVSYDVVDPGGRGNFLV